MGKPHPIELRERVVSFVVKGNSHRKAARHFRVSPRFVNGKLRAETGLLAARRQGHGPGGGKLGAHAGFVRKRMAENGELTLDALCVELAGRGVGVHRSNVCRLLHRLGLSHKKRRSRPKSGGAPTSPERASTGSSGAGASSPGPGASSPGH